MFTRVSRADKWVSVQGTVKLNGSTSSSSTIVVILCPTAKLDMKIHPDLVRDKKKTFDIRIVDGSVSPTISIMQPGDELRIHNADDDGYNLSFGCFANHQRNLIVRAGRETKTSFLLAEPVPLSIQGNIRTLSPSQLVILEHPYATLLDKNGGFLFEKVAPGEYELRVYRSQGLTKKKIVLNSSSVDIGEIKVAEKKANNAIDSKSPSPD